MKKYIFSVIALAASLTGCTGDYTDWASPITNDQPQVVTFGDGSVKEVGLIDFADASLAGEGEVQVCEITAPTASDSNYELMPYKLWILGEEFNIETNGKMSKEDLRDYVETLYGKAPVEHDLDAYLEQWVTNGTTTVKTAVSQTFKIKVKLDAPTIYDHLYLIGGVEGGAWDPTSTALPFTHSDQNVYDDPVFTITVPVADGDTWFAFADDNTVSANDWSQVFGCREGNGSNKVGETGKLARRADLSDEGSFKISVNGDAKFMKITVNMLNGTYLIEKVNFQPYIYYVGTANGWDNTASGVSMKLKLTDENTGTYSGYIYCKEESYGNTFRFLKNYGDWGDTYGNPDVTTYDGPMEAGSSDGNFNATAGTGLYYVELSIGNGTMKAVKIDNMNLVGNFNGWNEKDDAQQMTWNADEFCYEMKNAGVTADGWKFTANNSWDINLGGALTNLTANGDNISSVGSTIKLYPCRTNSNNIYCTVE